MGIFGFLASIFAGAQDNDTKVEILDDRELELISKQIQYGRELLEKYLENKKDFTEIDIDEAIVRWRNSTDLNKESPEYLIENLGSYLGNLLVSRDNMIWCKWTDRHGTDYCVSHSEIQVQTFPHSTVYKAVVEGREYVLEDVTKALIDQINENISNPEIQTH